MIKKCDFDITANGCRTKGSKDADESVNGKELLGAFDFLQDLLPPGNAKAYSYGLKHRAEDYAGYYVSNGALIYAAVDLGYKVVRCKKDAGGDLNAWVYVDVKALKQIEKANLNGGLKPKVRS